MKDQKFVICTACGAKMPASRDLCEICRGPIGVKSLSQLNTLESDLAFHALIATLGQTRLEHLQRVAEGRVKPPTERELHWLKTWLNLYWLRPANAMLRVIDCIVLEQKKINPREPLLDLGCGDGIFTSVWRGFEFHPDFDFFRSLDLKAPDIYNHYEEGTYRGAIIKKGKKIAAGVDIRDALIKKAAELGSFEEVKTSDARNIPYGDASFASVFSNILDYFSGEDFNLVMDEVRRVLKKNGELVAVVTNHFYQKGMIYGPGAAKLEAQGMPKAAALYRTLDRGRSTDNYLQLSPEDWSKRFEKAGFEIKANITVMPQKIWNLWDTELRPFSVQLMGAAQALESIGLRTSVKRTIVDWMVKYLAMYVDQPYSETGCSNIIYARKK